MHLRQKLTFMVFGSILTLAGYLLATLVGDLSAQPTDQIVGRGLKIVDANGNTCFWLDADGATTLLNIYGKSGHRAVTIAANDTPHIDIASVSMPSKPFEPLRGRVLIHAGFTGGEISVSEAGWGSSSINSDGLCTP